MECKRLLASLQARTPSILGIEQFSKFAVLLPLVKRNGEIHVLYEVRSATLRRQPGEICFPGGKMDEDDETPEAAAIRETKEELGLHVTDVYPLDYMVSPFGTIIYPYVGVVENMESMIVNEEEVGEVFTVPLAYLQQVPPDVYHLSYKIETPSDFPYQLVVGGTSYKWQPRKMEEYFYQYEDRVIWGLTARITKHFLDLL